MEVFLQKSQGNFRMKISREFPYEDLKEVFLRRCQGNFLTKMSREFPYEDLKGISLRKEKLEDLKMSHYNDSGERSYWSRSER